jgi:SAM-dependent methyltransferase
MILKAGHFQTLAESRMGKRGQFLANRSSPAPQVSVHKMKRLDRMLEQWRIQAVSRYLKDGDQVLDIGCGNGEIFRQLTWLGPSVGIDPVLTPGNMPSFPNTRFFSGMFPEALPEPMKFDGITLLAVLEHLPAEQQATLAKNCAAHLKPGGRLLITVPSPITDYVLLILTTLRLMHGTSLEQHYGFDICKTPEIFEPHGFRLLKHKWFQFGLNNLFAFERLG